MSQRIIIGDLLEDHPQYSLRAKSLTGAVGLKKEIRDPDVNRPGLPLSGFYDYFAFDRIQIFGKGESAYLRAYNADELKAILERFFSYEIFCCIFTHGDYPPDIFIEFAKQKSVPVLLSDLGTTNFITSLNAIILEAHAPVLSTHATLVDVYGLGVLLLGKSGVGKSETALELIERGHRLVADDIVTIKRIEDETLLGSGSEIVQHHMEIRGLGIINVKDIFGIRSVKHKKRIELVCELEYWDESKLYDRLGLDESWHEILGVRLPYVVIPVRPGRNIPVIVETAALNQRMKKYGIHTAQELDQKIQNWISSERNNDREDSAGNQ